MLDRIDQLEKRVNELEAEKRSLTAPAVAPLVAVAPKPTDMEGMAGMPMHDPSVPPPSAVSYPSLHVAGFSDIDFSADTRKGDHSGFSEGQFVLHISSALSPRVTCGWRLFPARDRWVVPFPRA